MKIIKEIFKLIITLLISVLIIISLLLNIFRSTILKEEYVLQKLEDINYYEDTYNEILSTFDNYILQSGLEEETLIDICSKEQVEKDTKKIIQNIYEGTQNKVDTENIKQKLNINIENELKGTELSQHTKQALEQLVNTICKEYEQKILQTQYDKKVNVIINKINNITNKAQTITYISIIVLVVVLILLSLKNEMVRMISWLGIAMLSAGGLLITINIFINSQIAINNISLLNKSVSKLVQTIGSELLSKIFLQGIIILGMGMVAIIIGNILCGKMKKGNITN